MKNLQFFRIKGEEYEILEDDGGLFIKFADVKHRILTTVDEIVVFIDPGFFFTESKLYVWEDDKAVWITQPSPYGENDDGEFLLRLNLPDPVQAKAMKIMNELAEPTSIKQSKAYSFLIDFTLKEEYEEIRKKVWEQAAEERMSR